MKLKNINNIKMELLVKRNEWRIVKTKKNNRKEKLLSKGMDKREARKDKIYKSFKKKQINIFRNIQHLEKKLNRMIAKLK